jgi:hypothetical protein
MRPFRQSPSDGRDERIIAFAGLRAGGRHCRLRQWGIGGQPEAHEHGQRLDRDAEVPLEPRQPPVELVEALQRRGLLPFGERKEAIAASATSERDWSRRAA